MFQSRNLAIGLAAILFHFWSTTLAVAQAIPSNVLAADRAELMEGCLNRESDRSVCEFLTSCIEENFVNDLDYDMYKAMREQMKAQIITDEVRQYLDRVAVVCAAELRAQMQN